MTETRELDINISDSGDRLEELDAAVDLATDQDQRTAILAGGKRVAAIVTAEDLARLETLDAAFFGAPGTKGQEDSLSRVALLFAAILTADSLLSQAADDVLPGKPGNITYRRHIENWLREAS